MFRSKSFSISVCFLIFLMSVLCVSFRSRPYKQKVTKPKLTSVHIVDRNGFSETITNPDRLKQFQSIDFFTSQPYQKVLRIYSRNGKGDMCSFITSYHANGNPKQYLEIVNGRAFGPYYEWHSNGSMSLFTTILGGMPDITPAAEQSWLFDGSSWAWDDEGNVKAEVQYVGGELHGISTYYHKNGNVWKRIPYYKGLINGVMEVYLETGELLQQIHYDHDYKNGLAIRYWNANQIAAQEEYVDGLLITGEYYDLSGQQVAQICQGEGHRALFGRTSLTELQEYHQGVQDGEIQVFGKSGHLIKTYHVKNGHSHGEEQEFYPGTTQPKLSVAWYEGKIQGLVKTWYDNGTLESQRELSTNAKNGLSTAWYRDGSLMLIEEYDHDKLIRGDYFKKGDKIPVSFVQNGKGEASLFDAEGNFIRKVSYGHGKPQL